MYKVFGYKATLGRSKNGLNRDSGIELKNIWGKKSLAPKILSFSEGSLMLVQFKQKLCSYF